MRDRRRDVRGGRRVDDQISPLEEGDVGVLSEGAQKIALADVAERNERLAYPLAGADAPVQGLVELRLSDEAGFDQRLTEPNSARHEDVVARATGCAPETRSVVVGGPPNGGGGTDFAQRAHWGCYNYDSRRGSPQAVAREGLKKNRHGVTRGS